MDIINGLYKNSHGQPMLCKVITKSAPISLNALCIDHGFTNPFTDTGKSETLYNKKTEIDEHGELFNKYRSLTNPYELVATQSRKFPSATNISVVSRAYFKLWEILSKIDGLLPDEPIIYTALAEAPGGFVQSVLQFRMKQLGRRLHDTIYSITLNTGNGLEMKWAALWRRQFKINYGDPSFNDGDLLNPYNIIAFVHRVNLNRCLATTRTKPTQELINILLQNRRSAFTTADGGTCVPIGIENYQEQMHFPLFFNEILTALMVQKNGGSFILKIYDMFTLPTIQIIAILTQLYDTVYITKPLTSRPANSERYIVCKGFKGDKAPEYQKIIYQMINISFSMYDHKINITGAQTNFYVRSISKDPLNPQFIDQVRTINNNIIDHQLTYIDATLQLMRCVSQQHIKKRMYTYIKLKEQIIKEQLDIGREWCIDHNIEPFNKI